MGKAREERYRVIAALLQYPEPAWLEIIPQARAYSRRLPAGRIRDTIEAFLDHAASQPLLRLQENFTAVFDLNPATTLNMSCHVSGDGRKRAALLASLQQGYRRAGYEGPDHELPDFLPAMIEFLTVCRDATALEPFRRCLAGLAGLVDRLRQAAPPYAHLLELLAEDYQASQPDAELASFSEPVERRSSMDDGLQNRRDTP
jgi:nitrate reductase molybdenum cofactor assembly chaperone NarJ/NarW